MMMKLMFCIPCLSILACGCAGIGAMPAASHLPPYWIVQEGTYSGIWTRRPHSELYEARWTRGSEVVTDTIQFEWVHNDVIAFRRLDLDGRYIGILDNKNDGLAVTRGAMSWSTETWYARAATRPPGVAKIDTHETELWQSPVPRGR